MPRRLSGWIAAVALLTAIWLAAGATTGSTSDPQYYSYLPIILRDPTSTPTLTPTPTSTPIPAPTSTNPRSDPITETQPSWIQEVSGAQYDIIRLHQLTPCENAGGMNIAFLEVRDQNGQPLNGITIVIEGSELKLYGVSGTKDPGTVEVPLTRDSWKAYIEGATSDIAMELREDLPNQDSDECSGGNRGNHYSYKVIFQKMW